MAVASIPVHAHGENYGAMRDFQSQMNILAFGKADLLAPPDLAPTASPTFSLSGLGGSSMITMAKAQPVAAAQKQAPVEQPRAIAPKAAKNDFGMVPGMKGPSIDPMSG